MSKFNLTDTFSGYHTKKDRTNMSARFLVEGSQNVLINDADKIRVRKGFTLDGNENTDVAQGGIQSEFGWDTSGNVSRNLRGYDDELEYRYVDSLGVVTWRRLADAFTATDFSFTTWWDNTQGIDKLIFVNGNSSMYEWTGAITTLASVAAGTLTKQGVTTWQQDRFYTTNTRQVIVDGVTYTYTGGENTTTLTGVTPDPTLGGHTVGAIVHQAIRTTATTPASGFNNDAVSVLNNQILVLSNTSRVVYMSKNTNPYDFAFSSPRISGEGQIFTLDSAGVSFVPQENTMYISAGKSDWYAIKLSSITVGTTLSETASVEKLKSTPLGGSLSQNLTTKTENLVAFISNENSLTTLGQIENVSTPQSKYLSDPIKSDFDRADFTGGFICHFKSQILVSAPADSLVYIYDTAKQYWQPPQIMQIGAFSIIEGELYGHDTVVPQTYKLFTGTNDNGGSMVARATLAYRNFGDRAVLKQADEWYTEGYLSENCELTTKYLFDYKGQTQTVTKTILGIDTRIVYESEIDESIGVDSLAYASFGGEVENDPLDDDGRKFRVIHKIAGKDFFEVQTVYESDGTDFDWQILASGAQVRKSPNQAIRIKQ